MRKVATGTRYGKLVTIGTPEYGKVTYRCDCGETFTATTRANPEDCGCTALTLKTGDTVGPLTVTGRPGYEAHNRGRLNVECQCGYEAVTSEYNLLKADYHKRCPWRSDLIGQRFGKLVVKEPTGNKVRQSFEFLCECDCGGTIKSISAELKRMSVQSCGCLQKELARERGLAGFPTQQTIGFPYAHRLVQETRGKAEEYLCWDCNAPANVWSFNKETKYALTVVSGPYKGSKYSMDVDDYDPRCSGCHGDYIVKHRELQVTS